VHGFVNCIGVLDGKLNPLTFAPMVNREDYYTKKEDYAIKGLDGNGMARQFKRQSSIVKQ
jgi:hypothetical protein